MDRLDPVILHHVVNTLGWPDLRPLQRAAIHPLMDGEDAVLLAPTAGGKTEAACLPILSAMSEQRWTGTSVLYLCPLKALLNNLVTRVDGYAQWLGRRAALWHGDTKESQRRRIRTDRPDILLTTPESLEAMLIGVKTDHAHLLAGVRAVVVDEVHAFAGTTALAPAGGAGAPGESGRTSHPAHRAVGDRRQSGAVAHLAARFGRRKAAGACRRPRLVHGTGRAVERRAAGQ